MGLFSQIMNKKLVLRVALQILLAVLLFAAQLDDSFLRIRGIQSMNISPTGANKTSVSSPLKSVDHVHHRWNKSTVSVMPLVNPLDEGIDFNVKTNESIYYKPTVGYSFPVNGQGGRWGNHFYPASVLHFKLEPDEVFTKRKAKKCLQNMKWIHIDGDSLARDVYYDLSEVFGMPWNKKKKTLGDLTFGADGKSAPRISFSADTIRFHTKPNWYKHSNDNNGTIDCPDVWLYSSGLWDHPAKTSNAAYYNRTKAIANFEHNHCVQHKILRYTTPYQDERNLTLNPRAMSYNRIATELLVPVGFQYVDTFEILESRPDLSHDGVHYTGPGSKWVTNVILNLVC